MEIPDNVHWDRRACRQLYFCLFVFEIKINHITNMCERIVRRYEGGKVSRYCMNCARPAKFTKRKKKDNENPDKAV